jgi:hypothetical protein
MSFRVTVIGGGDAWYQPRVERMRADPIMTYFYKLRSEILKEEALQTGASTTLPI